jgi:hypothetical protein
MPLSYPFSKNRRVSNSFTADARFQLRWGGIVGGTLTALLAYGTLMAAGLVFGGASWTYTSRSNTDVEMIGVGSAVWMVAAILIALGIGGYVSGRTAGLVPARMARIQGTVMAALFFGVLSLQTQPLFGSMGEGLGKVNSALKSTTKDMARSASMQETFDEAIGDLKLKSTPEVVAAGVASRLLRGKDNLALNYLAHQGNISRAEAQRRIETVKARFDQIVMDTASDTADSVAVAGWSLLLALFFGTSCAAIGAGYAARRNLAGIEESEEEGPAYLQNVA